MSEFIKVAIKDDIKPGTGKKVDLNGTPLALFNVDGTFYAIDNTCLHRKGPLGDGEVEKNIVTCPWHGWKYDILTGNCQTNPGLKVKSFKVKVEGEDILVGEEQNG